MKTYTVKDRPTLNKPLQAGDTVIFHCGPETLKYEVRSDHLNHIGGNNERIFELLGIKEHLVFLSRCYGYAADPNSWHECKHDDMPALTRAVIRLYGELELWLGPEKLKNLYIPPNRPTKAWTSHARNEDFTLMYGDSVEFMLSDGRTLTFLMDYNHLNGPGSNDEIFRYMCLSESEIDSLAKLIYQKYYTGEGTWPSVNEVNDGSHYIALTKMVKYIWQVLWTHDLLLELDQEGDYYGDCRDIKKKFILTGNLNLKAIADDLGMTLPPHLLHKPVKSSINPNTNKDGKTIEVPRVTPEIFRGPQRRGNSVSGRECKTTTVLGHLGYRKIVG